MREKHADTCKQSPRCSRWHGLARSVPRLPPIPPLRAPEGGEIEEGPPDGGVVVCKYVLLVLGFGDGLLLAADERAAPVVLDVVLRLREEQLLGRRLHVLLPAVLLQDGIGLVGLQALLLLAVDPVHHLDGRRVGVEVQVLPLVVRLELVELQRGELGGVARGADEVVAHVHVLAGNCARQRVLAHRARLGVVVGRVDVEVEEVPVARGSRGGRMARSVSLAVISVRWAGMGQRRSGSIGDGACSRWPLRRETP
eukprot:6186512-Pleurochrysis_carterae.AAC.6